MAPDGRHNFSFGEELTAGFDWPGIYPALTTCFLNRFFANAGHRLNVLIHRRLVWVLGDQQPAVSGFNQFIAAQDFVPYVLLERRFSSTDIFHIRSPG